LANFLFKLTPRRINAKKKWRVSHNYEPNRLALSHLADAYESLLPRGKYKLKLSKKTKEKGDAEFEPMQEQGVLK
jgi:hypothetical protein